MSGSDDLSFSLIQVNPVQRSAFRAMVKGLFARFTDGARFDVHDISASGCSLAMPLHAYVVGHEFTLDLMAGDKVLLAALQARIVRLIPDGLAACAFMNVSRHQEFKLDKLILEIQKRKIAQRKNLAREYDDDGETSGETAT
ncbi:MAG: PilZ domain-containing protein [Desulfovibrionaceae bacterium]